MTAGTKRAVLFDLDGTLLDSLGDLANSMNTVLSEDGLPTHEVDAFRYFIGEGVSLLVQRSLPEDKRDPATAQDYLERYRDAYATRWHLSKPFPGIPELLDKLQTRGVPLAVVSNKPEVFTKQCIQRLFPDWKWDCILGQSDALPRKPDAAMALHAAERLGVAPKNCLFVGDSDIDILTGVNAGMSAVGVSWGFRQEAELREAGMQHFLQKPADLLELIE